MKFRIILIIGMGLVLAACSGDKREALRAAGVVDGDVVTVRSKVGGRLDAVKVGEGGTVETGQVLARVDARSIGNRIEAEKIRRRNIRVQRQRLQNRGIQFKAACEYALLTSRRLERLREKSAVSGDQLEQARLKLISARTTMTDNQRQLEALDVEEAASINREEALGLQLEDHTLTAPVAGVVLEVHAVAGENLFPGTTVLEILDTRSLFVEVFVEEDELSGLARGQDAMIHVDGRREPVTGRISFFGRRAEFSPKYVLSEKERRNLLVQVKVRIPQAAADNVKLGMPVTVAFAR